MAETITCPSCGTEIELSQALYEKIALKVRAEASKKVASAQKALEKRQAELEEQKNAVENQRAEIENARTALDATLQQRLAEEVARLQGKARQQETELRARLQAGQAELDERQRGLESAKGEVEKARAGLDATVHARLAEERVRLTQEERTRAEDAVAVELRDLQESLSEANTRVVAARQAKLELRRRERTLVQEKQELEIRVERRLAEESERIRAEATRQATEEQAMRVREKEEQIEGLRGKIEELKRRAEQGSQQLQGEVQELALQDLLEGSFPDDLIEEVAKGAHGGDVVQHVRDEQRRECGRILWESKRTKAWSDGWLAKLRDDQRATKADCAVIVTATMPKGPDTFAHMDGVWVTSWKCAAALAGALRVAQLGISRTKVAMQGQQTKMAQLYSYLTGTEFRNHMTGVVEAFVELQKDLETERRAMERIWAKREKQIRRAIQNGMGMYGDLQGIVGASLASIQAVEEDAVEPPALVAGDVPEPEDSEDGVASWRPAATQIRGARQSQAQAPVLPTTDNHILERIVLLLRSSKRPVSVKEVLSMVPMPLGQWTRVVKLLEQHPAVTCLREKNGTNYMSR